jgi:predicted alpha/beta-fold hydrolase
MPVISNSTYAAPLLFRNAHVQTVYPSLFRRVAGVEYSRRRITTPDDDFIDVDIASVGAPKAGIILHGLEGNSGRSYVLGMARVLTRNGWDAIAVNFRGCSGESNKLPRFYHSGDTEDLSTVLTNVEETDAYEKLALIGFSLGGNLILKYLGERGASIHASVQRSAVFSVPCDLCAGARKIGSPGNRPYMKRFLRMLREKIRAKMAIMPGRINDNGYESIKDFEDFDNHYTAPLHGFKDAEDYWNQSSCKQYIPEISVPTLLVNAQDDPFLTPECYPWEEAARNQNFFFEITRHGGHVGFVSFNASRQYWSELRAAAFLNTDS